MKVYGYCKSCGNTLVITQKVTSREEIRALFGITVLRKCGRCGVSNQLLVNGLKAKRPKTLGYSVVEMLIVGVLMALLFIGFDLSQEMQMVILVIYISISILYLFYTRKHCLRAQRFNR